MSKPISTSDQILACARTLILSGGYNGFSYADVAGVVGIRKASVHHHFASKVDLVRTLVSRYRDEAAAGFAELGRQIADPLEELRAYAGYWERCIGDGSAPFCICALLASELPALPEDVAREVQAFFRGLSAWLTGVFERGEQQGRFRLTSPPHIEAEMFIATAHGAMLSSRAYADPKMFGAIMAPLLERLSAQRSNH